MNVYSFLNTNCTLIGPGGFVQLGAGASVADEGIEILAAGDINVKQMGADGGGQHSLKGDKSGTLRVSLLKTSPTNQLLSLMYAFQTASASTHGQNIISLVDTLRGDAVTARQVAFKKAPDLRYGTEAGLVVWEFDAIIIDRALGA